MKRHAHQVILILTLVPLVLVASFSYIKIREDLTDLTLGRFDSIAQLSANSLQRHFDSLKALGLSLATRVRFINLVNQGNWEEAVKIMEAVPKNFPYIDRILLADPKGVLMADVPPVPEVRGINFSHRDWYQGVSRNWEPYLSNAYRRTAAPQRNVIAVAIPIKTDDLEVVGILVIQIRLETLLEWSQAVTVGPKGFIYFVDREGKIAASPQYPPQEDLVDYSEVPVVQKVLRGERGVGVFFNPVENEERVSAYRPVEGYGWGVIAQEPTKFAFLHRNKGLRFVLIVYLFVFVLSLLLSFIIIRILSERERAVAVLRQSEEKIRLILQTAYDAFIAINREGRITEWNRQAELIFGWSLKEAIGRTLVETIIPPQYHEAHQKGLKHFLETGEGPVLNRRIELAALHRDGHEFPVEITIWPVKAGEHVYFNAFLRDISEKRRLEESEKRKTEELARSNQDLEQFAYVASHDLQEPLRMVSSYTQLLAKRYQLKLDKDADDFIGYAVDGAKRMQLLIHDLLEYSRVSADAKPFQPVEMGKVVRLVLDNLKMAIQEINAEMTFDPLPTVSGDEMQMARLLQNLIRNALKFRGKEPARIHISSEKKEDQWVFSVKDNGIGIEPAYFERIFQIFQRLHPRDKYPGTGIGLAVCKRIVENHGGKIWVESQKGSGATFFFSLPVIPLSEGEQDV
ncbi:MAG: PAS domain S-box protein [Deltaproteobacteria bacterium]|nr:PAS domain S-box protein [Deltaproteobacteria bacterium]